MRQSTRGRLTLVAAVVATAVAVPGCSPSECSAGCQDAFRAWVKRGAIGTPPASALGYCKVHPSNSYC